VNITQVKEFVSSRKSEIAVTLIVLSIIAYRQVSKSRQDTRDANQIPASTLLSNASVCSLMGNRSEAIKKINESIKLNDRVATAYSLRGTLSMESGDFKGAIIDFKTAIKLDANDSSSHYFSAKCYFEMKNSETALEFVDKAIILNPQDPYNYILKSDICKALGDQAGSDRSREMADSLKLVQRSKIKVKPDLSADSRLPLFYRLYLKSLDVDSAYEKDDLLTKSIQLSPTFQLAYLTRGDLRKSRGKIDDALQDYKKCLELKPDDKMLLALLVDKFEELKEFSTSRAIYDKLIAIDKKDHKFLVRRGVIQIRLHKFNEAIIDFSEVLNRSGSYWQAYFLRAHCKRQLGDEIGAIEDTRLGNKLHLLDPINDKEFLTLFGDEFTPQGVRG